MSQRTGDSFGQPRFHIGDQSATFAIASEEILRLTLDIVGDIGIQALFEFETVVIYLIASGTDTGKSPVRKRIRVDMGGNTDQVYANILFCIFKMIFDHCSGDETVFSAQETFGKRLPFVAR